MEELEYPTREKALVQACLDMNFNLADPAGIWDDAGSCVCTREDIAEEMRRVYNC